METRISIDGLDEIADIIDASMAHLKKEISIAIQGAGINCEGYAKQACPTDNAVLKTSIHAVPIDDYTCEVNTSVKYAPYVEHGTYASRDEPYVDKPKGMKPRPFLFPAYLRAKKELIDELKALKAKG